MDALLFLCLFRRAEIRYKDWKFGTNFFAVCVTMEERGKTHERRGHMTSEAAEQRRIYMRRYREKNRERINRRQREWRAKNPDKVRELSTRYWEKKAAEV